VENYKFHRIDLNYDLKQLLELVDEIRPSIIVNFAAQGMVAESWLKPNHWYQTNVLSQVALHDELRKLEYLKKYVHITTPEVYGSTDKGWIKEDERFTPSTPYAVSRAACDLHLMSFHKAYGFPVVFTRAANVYGPGQQLYRIIPRAMLSGRTGKKLPLHGGGTSKRCFIHIRDAMEATLMLAKEAESGTTWHLSTKEPISIKNLVENICEKIGVDSKDIIEETDDRLGKDQSYLLDSKSIRQNFNWKEKVSLAEGLSETLDWIDTNLENLARMPWSYTHKA
jgi:dTDP-glucose 4,6-dehydratase